MKTSTNPKLQKVKLIRSLLWSALMIVSGLMLPAEEIRPFDIACLLCFAAFVIMSLVDRNFVLAAKRSIGATWSLAIMCGMSLVCFLSFKPFWLVAFWESILLVPIVLSYRIYLIYRKDPTQEETNNLSSKLQHSS